MPPTQFDLSGLYDEHSLKALVAKPLAELCVQVIASNFKHRPTLRGIPPRYVPAVTELLPTTLPLDVTGPLIDDEEYWERCARARWDLCQISDHGSSWKRFFFERHLSDFLEEFDPLRTETEELIRVLSISKDYIFSVRLQQFLAHLDMEMLFQHLPLLSNLQLTYGVKQIGMEYEKVKFGMKLTDVTSLAKACRLTETLTILSLPGNLLDDPAVRILATGLADNSTVTALDLSHNKIADRGVKAIARLLDGPSVLMSLNLADNAVHADGGRYVGRGLRGNCSLQHLNLRLNRLGDEGGRMLLDGALDNQTLLSLNLSCNALDFSSAQAACAVLATDQSGLRSLDLSGNLLSEEAGRILLDTVSSGSRLTSLDLRLNQVLAETVASIEEMCKRNVASQAEQRAAAAASIGA